MSIPDRLAQFESKKYRTAENSTLTAEDYVSSTVRCIYTAGEGFFDPGVVHNADNLSADESARAYAVFLGIPDGEPATIRVEPVEC